MHEFATARGGGGSSQDTELHIWPHQTYVNADNKDLIIHDMVVQKMDIVCDVFEDYFGSFPSFRSVSAQNHIDQDDYVIGFQIL